MGGDCIIACVVDVDMFVAPWVLHRDTKNGESGSVWYVLYVRTMYVQSYVIWYREYHFGYFAQITFSKSKAIWTQGCKK